MYENQNSQGGTIQDPTVVTFLHSLPLLAYRYTNTIFKDWDAPLSHFNSVLHLILNT